MTALAHLSGAAELLCELLGLDLVQRQPRDVVGFEVGDVLPRQCVCVCVCVRVRVCVCVRARACVCEREFGFAAPSNPSCPAPPPPTGPSTQCRLLPPPPPPPPLLYRYRGFVHSELPQRRHERAHLLLLQVQLLPQRQGEGLLPQPYQWGEFKAIEYALNNSKPLNTRLPLNCVRQSLMVYPQKEQQYNNNA